MKLYSVPISPNCRRVEATIGYLNLNVEIYMADMMGGELKSEQFLALNPNGRVPVLIDGEQSFWESNSIMQYLADKNSAEHFYPTELLSRVEINRWQFWESLHYNKVVASICWETIAKPALNMGQPDEATIVSATEQLHPFAKVLNAQLEKRPFIMGDTVTLADFSVGNFSALALHPNSQVPLDDYLHIKNWYESLERIPAWSQTAPSL